MQPERTRLGDERGVGDGFGQVGEQARHLGRRAQPAGAVGLEQPARGIEGAVLADAGEHVGERTVGGGRDQRVLRRHHAHAGRARQAREGGVARLLAAALVALHLHRHALGAEDPGEAAQHRGGRLLAAFLQRPHQRPARPAGERDEAGRVLLDQFPAHPALSLAWNSGLGTLTRFLNRPRAAARAAPTLTADKTVAAGVIVVVWLM